MACMLKAPSDHINVRILQTMATGRRVKPGKETKFSESVATLLKRASTFMENAKKTTLSPIVSANTMVSSFPETALIAKMLDARLPVPGLLQLPLIDEVRAGLEKHVANIIDFDETNSISEPSRTSHEAQRRQENQIGTPTRPLLTPPGPWFWTPPLINRSPGT